VSDLVELSIPVRADLVVLARLTAATVASRTGFDLEEIEDLRLAVEELCLLLVGTDDAGRLSLAYERADDCIEISCTHVPDEAAGTGPRASPEPPDDLSSRILDALVDEHGRDAPDGRQRAWLRKRRN
jgi:hypothetical protein